MIKQTCCFTGHRIIPYERSKEIYIALKQAIILSIEEGYKYFGVGGALGFDMMAAQTILKLKSKYPQIKLILILPCKDQAKIGNLMIL